MGIQVLQSKLPLLCAQPLRPRRYRCSVRFQAATAAGVGVVCQIPLSAAESHHFQVRAGLVITLTTPPSLPSL